MADTWFDIPQIHQAEVYKGDVHAATLTRGSAGVEFKYLPQYLEQNTDPVASTLPLSDDALVTPAGAVPPFFAGLLPEGRRLTAIRRAIKTSADDELSLLLAIGGDAVGNVTVVPEGEIPQPVSPAVEVSDFGKLNFSDVFAQTVGGEPDRVGIPGVQDKVSARMITMPVRRAGDQYILKLNPPEFPALVENEAYFLEAARLSGLNVVDAKVVYDIENKPGLLIRRFDRELSADGGVRALAVEDACQVLGRYPSDKYAVTSETVATALISLTQAKSVAARDLFRQFAFAYLTGNGDAHAKNFSVLRPKEGDWRISPAYDLPSSHPYGDYTLALSIGGRRQENVTHRTFVAFGETLGLPMRASSRALDDICERADLWIHALGDLPFDQQKTRKLKRAIEYRRKQLRPTSK